MKTASSITDLVRDTEREVFEFGAEADQPLLNDDDIADLDLDEVEGWDGEALGIDEIAAAAAGADPNNNDRPLRLQDELDATRELIELDKALLAQGQQFEDAEQAAKWAEQRKQLAFELIDEPKGEAAIDRIVQQQNQIAILEDTVLNQHLNHTAERYGRDRFNTAYNNLLASHNPNNPRDVAYIRNEILGADDPGLAILEWHESGGGVGRGRMPPSLNSQQAAWGNSSSSRDAARYSDWAADQDSRPYSPDHAENDAVFNDVWRD